MKTEAGRSALVALAALLVVCNTTPLRAQAINGRVVDETRGTPVAGAVVRTPLLAMHADGDPVPVDLEMRPEPLGVEGLEVTVKERANDLLQPLGLRTETLGKRWIDRAFMDSVQVKMDVGDIIRRKAPPGVYVLGEAQRRMNAPFLCIQLQRGRGLGKPRCAMVVVDGVPIDPDHAAILDPDAFEAIAILNPAEAATIWGSLAGAGAVLMWSRRGSSR